MLTVDYLQRTQGVSSPNARQPSGLDMPLSIVPDNVVSAASNNGSIMALMFFAVQLGVGMVLTPPEKAVTLKRGIGGEASMTLVRLVDLAEQGFISTRMLVGIFHQQAEELGAVIEAGRQIALVVVPRPSNS